MSMKLFKCHKVVSAFLVGKIEGNLIFDEDEVFEPVEVPTSFFDKHDVNGDCYLVKYSDGYLSISPKTAFEEGYSSVVEKSDSLRCQYPDLKYFEYGHLPEFLQVFSKPFHDLAWSLVSDGVYSGETDYALRKLLESKDCAVRAQVK